MAEQQLNRVLGKGFSVAASVGTIVGLGILRTPGEIASSITDPWIYMALWIGGGLFVLLSVLVVAELFATTPKSGGVYALVRHAFGAYPGFVIGWIDWLSITASSALKAVVLVEYLALVLPGIAVYSVQLSLFVTTVFAGLQLAGVRMGGTIHQSATGIIGVCMLLLAAALFLGIGSGDPGVAIAQPAVPGIAQFGLVAAAIVFTYDGWSATCYFGGEIRGGGRQVALGSIRGILIVIMIYVLLNLALVMSVPLAALQGQELALAAALEQLYGSGTIVIFLALFILLTHQNMNYMAASRVIYALSVDDMGSNQAKSVNGRGTPTGAVLFTWGLSILLISVGGFRFLLNMTALMFMLMYISLVVGVFRLRSKEPDIERPYKAWGFPFTGYICIVGWVAIAIFVAVTDLKSAVYGTGLVVFSIPAYLWLKSRRHLVTA
jgi:APA family basic amino acid/polyamine antiporter